MTLWDVEARLKTTLTNDTSKEEVRCLEFGRGQGCRLLYAAMKSQLFVWDLVSLDLVWTVPVVGEIVFLTSCPLTGHLAVLAKDHVTLLNTWDRATVATVPDVHATGGAVYGVSDGQANLYYVTYNGLVKKIGPRQDQSRLQRAQTIAIQAKPAAAGLLLPKASGRTGQEIAAQSRAGGDGEDVAALLSVPLHALPATSLLARSFLLGRVSALPRLRAPAAGSPEETAAFTAGDQLKATQRIQNIFQTEKKPAPELDIKSFVVLLKKSFGDKKYTDG